MQKSSRRFERREQLGASLLRGGRSEATNEKRSAEPHSEMLSVEDMRAIFRSKDESGSGVLEGNALACAFASATGRKPTPAELRALTLHGNGRVIEDAFIGYLCERTRSLQQRELAREAFRSIDRRGAGCVDRHDFASTLHRCARAIPSRAADDAFELADADSDGRIGWRDFESLFFEGSALQQTQPL